MPSCKSVIQSLVLLCSSCSLFVSFKSALARDTGLELPSRPFIPRVGTPASRLQDSSVCLPGARKLALRKISLVSRTPTSARYLLYRYCCSCVFLTWIFGDQNPRWPYQKFAFENRHCLIFKFGKHQFRALAPNLTNPVRSGQGSQTKQVETLSAADTWHWSDQPFVSS
jgi:hypothetical protein